MFARAYTAEHQSNLLYSLAAKMAEEPFRLVVSGLYYLLTFLLLLSLLTFWI